MTSTKNKLTKLELQIYILLTCASADGHESEEEIAMIKKKTDTETFEKVYNEFQQDDEDERLDKIDTNIHLHTFENMELSNLRREMYEIFFSDCNFSRMERTLDRIMDNIIY